MPAPEIEYRGIRLSEAEKRRISESALDYLEQSKIPERYKTDLCLAVSNAGKAGTNLYHAGVFNGARAPVSSDKFAGEFYFPMPPVRSYGMVVGEGLAKADDAWPGNPKFPIRCVQLVSNGNMTAISSTTEYIPMSELWDRRIERYLEGADELVEAYLEVVSQRLEEHKYVLRFTAGRNEGDIEGFKSRLKQAYGDDIFYAIIFAAGKEAVKDLYDDFAKYLLSYKQLQTLQETLINLENYQFFLTGKC